MEQDDDCGMQEDVGQMKSKWIGAPDRAIDGVGHVHHGTERTVGQDEAEVRQIRERRIRDNGVAIVVHERIVERVEIDERREHRGQNAT